MWTLSIQPPRDSGLAPVDVVVQAREGATVRDFAEALAAHLARQRPDVTHIVPVTAGTPWPAGQPLAECGLRNGDLLDVVPLSVSWAREPGQALRRTAVLRVVTGPDAGRRVPLTGYAATIGRAHGCTVRLTDAAVSRSHARILLSGPHPVVVDEGSAGGTLVSGLAVTRPTPVTWEAPISLGDTTVVLEPADGGPRRDDTAVLRPPRLGTAVAAEVVEVATPPSRGPHNPMSWGMMLLPLLFGVTMFGAAFNPLFLVAILGWPVLMLVDHMLQRRHLETTFTAELTTWRSDLEDVLERIDACAADQREQAVGDHPAPRELPRRVLGREPALWGHRLGADDFLACRVGIGPVPALVRGTLDRGGDRAATAEATAELDRRRLLPDMPVVMRVGDASLIAITGADREVDEAARALLVRLCADHSPVELSVVAILSLQRTHHETWLRWLPHAASRIGDRAPVAVGAADGHALLDALVAEDGGHGATICVIDEAAGVSRRRIEMIVGQAARRRLHLVWLGRSADSVPAATALVYDLGRRVLLPADRGGVREVTDPDRLDLSGAWHMARAMHPYTDEVAVRPADSALPQLVRLPELAGDFTNPDDAAAVAERWAASRGLRAQLGVGIDGVVTVDLREDGPHALLAGTTGAGKSELLQTLICSLALNNPPSRMTFLLVDYKGGAAFRECADLPHTVGYITDLDPAGVRRALISLGAEITAREELLAEYGAKDLTHLEATHPEAAPPSLLICVDEFAALTAEVPDFVDGMVNIAQRGRSLGLHLFLATQRPAGVVTANIQANTDLRIALRVASPEDSEDVLDSRAAATISRRTPGRAWVRRIGHGTSELIQTGWVGAREELRAETRAVEVRPFSAARAIGTATDARLHPRTDLDRLVATVNSAFTGSGARRPQRPWLPPLAPMLPAAELPRDLPSGVVPIGLVDRPARRDQSPLLLDLTRVGHVLVHGASRSGKTELLRTVAAAGGPAAQIYCVDFGGGGLSALGRWPGVGAVVTEPEPGRVLRLLRMLDRLVRDRNRLLASHGAADLAAVPSDARPPRVHVLIDNLPAMLDTLEKNRLGMEHSERFTGVLQDGRRVGVHVIAATPIRGGLTSAVVSAFGERLVLRMSNEDEYSILGVPARVLNAHTPPGRGLIGTDEFQIALSTPESPENTENPDKPRPVPAMPTRLAVDELPPPSGDAVPFAVDADDISPVVAALRGMVLLVAGRARSGRSGLLAGIAEQAARSDRPPHRIVRVRPGGGPLPDLEDLAASNPTNGWSLLLVDDAHLFEQAEPDTAEGKALPILAELVRTARTNELGIVLATDAEHARYNSGDLLGPARAGRTGVLLRPEFGDDALLGVSAPSQTVEPLGEPGRGLWCHDGAARVVHVLSGTPMLAGDRGGIE